jgi:4'-phosphopantetheinyl transferase
MSASESARLAAIGLPGRAAEFIAGRLLARLLLVQVCGGTLADWPLSGDSGRAPGPVGMPARYVSISHSGDFVACAIATVPVGIDIEAGGGRRDRAALLQAITTPAEMTRLQGIGCDTDALLRHVWTVKEAWLKCRGGELFATMLGHGAELRPGAAETGNACSWSVGDAMMAVAVESLLPLDFSPPEGGNGLRYWHVGAPAPTGTAAH